MVSNYSSGTWRRNLREIRQLEILQRGDMQRHREKLKNERGWENGGGGGEGEEEKWEKGKVGEVEKGGRKGKIEEGGREKGRRGRGEESKGRK